MQPLRGQVWDSSRDPARSRTVDAMALDRALIDRAGQPEEAQAAREKHRASSGEDSEPAEAVGRPADH